ncbi:MAG: hypothetical protein ABSF03_22575 [Streptosporangiaceae bacterium]
MTARDTALTWARARSAGPLRVPAGTPAPAGMIKLPDAGGAEPGGPGPASPASAWLVPRVPETADARVLAEMGLPGPLLEQPNDTARMLAAVLRCCWEDPLAPVWPGVSAGSGPVLAVFREVTGPRDDAAHRRAAVAALRRLDQAGWARWDEPAGTVRLGPRVALWSSGDLATLRQLWRSIQAPERTSAIPALRQEPDAPEAAGPASPPEPDR